MSSLGGWGRDLHPAARRLATLAVAAVALGAIIGGGTLISPEAVTQSPARVPLVGRTSAICSVPTAQDQAAAPEGTTSVSAVAVRNAAGGREGRLTGAPLVSDQPELTVTEAGKGDQVAAAKAPIVLQAEGGLAAASSGAVFGTAATGTDTGLSAAPCLAPSTTHWFTGFGTGDADRTELVLTNPDDAQAEVDLRFYGRTGRIVVPGSPAVIVEAHATRTFSLATLVTEGGPFSLQIQASEGRVAAIARRTRTTELKPSGADWQLPSTSPALTTVIPTVPDGVGARDLVITNPGMDRATVAVQVLTVGGPIVPSGGASVEVGPESTVSLDLEPGLAGNAGAVKLTSDQPVTGAVASASARTGAVPDFAVQSAAAPLIRTGVSALATVTGTQSELILSNGGDTDTPVTFEVFSFAGVSLRADEVLLTAGSTATRRLTSPAPSYVVVTVPDGSAVVGGLVFTQPDGDVAGLTTLPLTSPDLASRAPTTQWDPAAGR